MAALLAGAQIALLPPQGYLEMLGLLADAKLVLTDSGGIQEETTALAVPCLTMRENTERPITVEQGTNTLVGRNRGRALDCVDEILRASGKRGRHAGALGRPRGRADRRRARTRGSALSGAARVTAAA